MRKLLRRLEARFGRYAIPNMTVALILGQVFMLMVAYVQDATVLRRIAFVPSKVIDGEVWRLITFLFYPPVGTPIIFAIIFWMLFYMFGTALESQWGAFRYNVYLMIGYLAAVAVAFLTPAAATPNTFLYGSVFLAFAWLFPDFVLHLFFILPIKIKWLALVMWLGYGLTLITGTGTARLQVIAAVTNFMLFFGGEIIQRARQSQRKRSFESRASTDRGRLLHRCHVCGVTSKDDPKMSFRYCSKCAGQMCYCETHIRDHEHVAAAEESSHV